MIEACAAGALTIRPASTAAVNSGVLIRNPLRSEMDTSRGRKAIYEPIANDAANAMAKKSDGFVLVRYVADQTARTRRRRRLVWSGEHRSLARGSADSRQSRSAPGPRLADSSPSPGRTSYRRQRPSPRIVDHLSLRLLVGHHRQRCRRMYSAYSWAKPLPPPKRISSRRDSYWHRRAAGLSPTVCAKVHPCPSSLLDASPVGVPPMKFTCHAATAVIFSVVLAAGGAAMAQQSRDSTARGQATRRNVSNQLYIVRLAEEPVVAYRGGIPGLQATRANRGQKIDPNSPQVVQYAGYLDSRHDEVLARCRRPESVRLPVLVQWIRGGADRRASRPYRKRARSALRDARRVADARHLVDSRLPWPERGPAGSGTSWAASAGPAKT